MRDARLAFVWPQEPYTPTSLFKHVVYLGETAGYARTFAEVTLVDLSVERWAKKALADVFRNSDIVLIPIEAYTVTSGLRLASLVKQTSKAKVIIYGTTVTMNARIFSQHEAIDAIISVGDWYRAIKRATTNPDRFFAALDDDRIYSDREPISDGEWALPPLDIMPMAEYQRIQPGQLDIGVQMGCNWNCSFCAEKSLFKGPATLHRPPENIAAFFETDPSALYYIDATTFTQDKAWAREVCRLVGQLKPVRRWRTVTRIDAVDEAMLDEMAAAGCVKIGFGIETLSPARQKVINKRLKEEQIRRIGAHAKRVGITPRFFLILGIPGQTADEVRYTREVVEDIGAEGRWKEYVPFEKIPSFSSFGQFEIFERNAYFMHPVPGLADDEYVSLLGTPR